MVNIIRLWFNQSCFVAFIVSSNLSVFEGYHIAK